jgi:hypothetical protein
MIAARILQPRSKLATVRELRAATLASTLGELRVVPWRWPSASAGLPRNLRDKPRELGCRRTVGA